MARNLKRSSVFSPGDGGVSPQRREAVTPSGVNKADVGEQLPAWVSRRPLGEATSSCAVTKPVVPASTVGEDSRVILQQRLLRVAEAASFFQVSEKTIRRLIDRGELPVVRLGRSVRIDPEVIEKMMVQSEQDRGK